MSVLQTSAPVLQPLAGCIRLNMSVSRSDLPVQCSCGIVRQYDIHMTSFDGRNSKLIREKDDSKMLGVAQMT